MENLPNNLIETIKNNIQTTIDEFLDLYVSNGAVSFLDVNLNFKSSIDKIGKTRGDYYECIRRDNLNFIANNITDYHTQFITACANYISKANDIIGDIMRYTNMIKNLMLSLKNLENSTTNNTNILEKIQGIRFLKSFFADNEIFLTKLYSLMSGIKSAAKVTLSNSVLSDLNDLVSAIKNGLNSKIYDRKVTAVNQESFRYLINPVEKGTTVSTYISNILSNNSSINGLLSQLQNASLDLEDCLDSCKNIIKDRIK